MKKICHTATLGWGWVCLSVHWLFVGLLIPADSFIWKLIDLPCFSNSELSSGFIRLYPKLDIQ